MALSTFIEPLTVFNTNLMTGFEKIEETGSSLLTNLNKINPLQFTDLNKNEKDDAEDFKNFFSNNYTDLKTIGQLLTVPMALFGIFSIFTSLNSRRRRSGF